eukprot:Tbor_TRINITY_DN5858_c5_g5::TRINITY_DN5858_c5_g5_i2::g.6806::m.6806
MRHTAFTVEEEKKMRGYKWEETLEQPQGLVYGFKIAEPKKKRARPVWACDINTQLKEGDFDSFKSSTREEVSEMMAKNKYFIEFDVKSMYYHISCLWSSITPLIL